MIDRPQVPTPLDGFAYRRWPTREVRVGDVGIGGVNPIRVQSMTSTRTLDTEATVAQAIRMVEAGSELVRITAPTVEDAANLRVIRDQLRQLGIRVPLIADIHFNPRAALEAARWVEKVRINPGNYADSRVFARREYTDAEYAAEIERIEERLLPLIRHCREYGVAMRIGTNHGSLSDRIMSRFGDTPRGMVESALEFVRICARHGYHEIVLSMKASNPKVMIQAYRLLALRMADEGMSYPLHLGVTEAGFGAEARVKSAAGIGALLDDGLGDTIRVSLAEEPEAELPVARRLAGMYDKRQAADRLARVAMPPARPVVEARDPVSFARRNTEAVSVGRVTLGGPTPLVAAEVTNTPARELVGLLAGGRSGPSRPDLLLVDLAALPAGGGADRIHLVRLLAPAGCPVALVASATMAGRVDGSGAVAEAAAGGADCLRLALPADAKHEELVSTMDAANRATLPIWLHAVESSELSSDGRPAWEAAVDDLLAARRVATEAGCRVAALSVACADHSSTVRAYRLLAARLVETADATPLVLHSRAAWVDGGPDGLALDAPIALGSLLVDGLGDAVLLEAAGPPGVTGPQAAVSLLFECLQAVGVRATKVELVACPSCGRTLFDLQTTATRIQRRIAHLVGVKVAVMGCVVNGPGELADADFGYMGGAPGKVSLYVGRECVERNVPAEEADDRLVALIKAHGRWIEPDEAG